MNESQSATRRRTHRRSSSRTSKSRRVSMLGGQLEAFLNKPKNIGKMLKMRVSSMP
jgi:hypothetical protein